MMSAADLLLLFLSAAILGAGIVATHRTLRRDAVNVQKYRLYKVRDDLVYLVAAGKLDERDLIFQLFYRASNHYIKHITTIKLHNLVPELEAARKNGVDPSAEEKIKLLTTELGRLKDEEVIQVVMGFFQAMMGILVQNSWLLRIITRHKLPMVVIAKFAEVTRTIRLRSTQRRAYWLYKEYSRASMVL